jgi:hypothetical protein
MLNTAIRMIESTKFLGIIIDSRLTWKDHITYVKNKLVRSIRTINLIKHKLDKGSIIQIGRQTSRPKTHSAKGVLCKVGQN